MLKMDKDKYFEANTDKCLAALIKYSDEHFSMSLESMSTLKMELIWLYTFLEVKAKESEIRGKPLSKEYLESINIVKKASMFITTYALKLEQMDSCLQELSRRNEYLEKEIQKASIKSAEIVYENCKFIYKNKSNN